VDEQDQRSLLEWGEARRRDLPWRRTRDPWAILVSETMLQQTQVPRVVSRYFEFLERFPTTAVCAAAPPGDVVRQWSGLGYNGRAIRLHGAARAVEREFGGAFPRTIAALQRLPGVGPYTARALMTFAFEADVAIVETNVARTLARWAGRSLCSSEVQAFADASVPEGDGWAWNQSLLDLGATVCRARGPACEECPWVRSCAWRGAGCPVPDPAVGTAHTGRRQSRFDGSDRQGRGRLVLALGRGPVSVDLLGTTMGWPDDQPRAVRVAAGVVADGLAVVEPTGTYRLP
jgi:A/G-specific adenine glycosylase